MSCLLFAKFKLLFGARRIAPNNKASVIHSFGCDETKTLIMAWHDNGYGALHQFIHIGPRAKPVDIIRSTIMLNHAVHLLVKCLIAPFVRTDYYKMALIV